MRAYFCQSLSEAISQSSFSKLPDSVGDLPQCRELTTKFLPVKEEDMDRLMRSPLLKPNGWQEGGPEKLWSLIQEEKGVVLNSEDFKKATLLFKNTIDRRQSIVTKKVTPFRLRVQHDPDNKQFFDPQKPYTTCTASMIKLKGKCHLFTNEHCVNTHPNVMTLDIPELSNQSWTVFEKEVAQEWDLMSLDLFGIQSNSFCENLEEQSLENQKERPMERPAAYYSLGYSGRSGEKQIDIFSSQVDQVDFIARDTARGSRSKVVNLEFPGGIASRYNYIPTFRGMSGGVLTDEEGNPLCLIHRTVPQQDTPQCIDKHQLEQFVAGELPRAKPEDNLLHPELFLRTYEKVPEESAGIIPTGNTTIPPGNTTIPPGNTTIPPGNTTIPPSVKSLLFSPLNEKCMEYVINEANPERDLGEFIEALEGVIDHNDGQRRELLAVRCSEQSPWQQIDGYEDYRLKLAHQCGDLNNIDEKNRVYRDQEGYVPLKYRENLLERLAGVFHTKATQAAGRLLHYDQLPGQDPMLTAKQRAAVYQRVHIDPDEGTIDLSLGNRPGPFIGGTLAAKFKVQFVDQGKKILLKPQFQAGSFPGKEHFGEMSCENKNQLKLICTGKTSAFSLSLKGEGEMAVRFTSYDPITKKMIHTHGDIYEDH